MENPVCGNIDGHARPARAVARLSWPDGRFKATTGCIGCMNWMVREALADGRPILVEPLTDWAICAPDQAAVPPVIEAAIRAKVADELEHRYGGSVHAAVRRLREGTLVEPPVTAGQPA